MTVWLDPIPYLGDDILFLDEVKTALGGHGITDGFLFRASEEEKRDRIERYGTDRGGYAGGRMWRRNASASEALRHEDVILATTPAQIERGARDVAFSTSFKKLPGIDAPLLLIYDAAALRQISEKDWTFRRPDQKRDALLAVVPVVKKPLPRGWLEPLEGHRYRALVREALGETRRADPSRPSVVVEVGSWKGRSAAYVGRLVTGLGAHFVCVDHYAGSNDEYAAAYLESLDIEDVRGCFEDNMRGLGIDVDLRVEPSVDAALSFRDESVSLVFLDASHDEASVSADIAAWLPKLAPGGVLAGHDYADDQPGVVAAVRALQRAMPVHLGPGSVWSTKRRAGA